MNSLWSKKFAALAAGLLVTMWASPSTALTLCEKLTLAGLAWGWGDGENPLKPVDVEVSVNGVHTRDATLTFTWNTPSARPAGTITGQCVHLRHISTGDEHEHCFATSSSAVQVDGLSCLGSRHGRPHCRYGNYNAKVKMQNNCDIRDRWSDSITFTR